MEVRLGEMSFLEQSSLHEVCTECLSPKLDFGDHSHSSSSEVRHLEDVLVLLVVRGRGDVGLVDGDLDLGACSRRELVGFDHWSDSIGRSRRPGANLAAVGRPHKNMAPSPAFEQRGEGDSCESARVSASKTARATRSCACATRLLRALHQERREQRALHRSNRSIEGESIQREKSVAALFAPSPLATVELAGAANSSSVSRSTWSYRASTPRNAALRARRKKKNMNPAARPRTRDAN